MKRCSTSYVIRKTQNNNNLVQTVKNLPAMQETWIQSLGLEDPLEKGTATHSSILAWRISWTVWFMGSQRVGHDWVTFTLAYLVAQTVKNLPAMPETLIQSLGREDPLEKEMAIHSSILAWEIPWTEKPGGLQSMGSQRVGHDWATKQRIQDARLLEWPKSRTLTGPNPEHWQYQMQVRMWSNRNPITYGNAKWYSHFGRMFGSFLQN